MNRKPFEDAWEDLTARVRATWNQLTGAIRRLADGRGTGRPDTFAVRSHTFEQPALPGLTIVMPRHVHVGRRSPEVVAVAADLALVGLGAGLMYYLDPDRGRRRRALVRDQLVHALHAIDTAIGVASRDMRNRSRGLWARTKSLVWSRRNGVPDHVLAERVRSKMGRYVSHPGSIDVAAHHGHVTLTGAILSDEVAHLLAAVASVPGVTTVENRLDTHDRSEGDPALQGRGRRTGERAELLQADWSPTARFLVGTAGGALMLAGACRGGAGRWVLGALGAGMLARAVTNVPVACLLEPSGSRSHPEEERRLAAEAVPSQAGRAWQIFREGQAARSRRLSQ
jgi:hypothetical protein